MSRDRDTIAIAFTESHYPTPYGDHTIAGNRPGHKERHLGRQYAPQPLTTSQLTHALTAPFVSGITPLEQSAGLSVVDDEAQGLGGNARIPGPRRPTRFAAARYILNVRHGGKRHFDEPVSATAEWTPSVRLVEPPHGDPVVVSRKGRGVYNFDHLDTVHEAAQRALEGRERTAQRVAVGKAHVDSPPDHHPIELGFYHVLAEHGAHATNASDEGTNDAQANATLTRLSSRALRAAGQVQGEGGDEGVVIAGDPRIAGGSSNVIVADDNGAKAGMVMPDAGVIPTADKISNYCGASLRASDEEAMWYMEQKRFMHHWRAARRAVVTAAQKREEVELVRHLPDVGS